MSMLAFLLFCLPWIAGCVVAARLAFTIGELRERSRWLVLAREAAENPSRERGMAHLLDVSVDVADGGGWPDPKPKYPGTRPQLVRPPPPPRGDA